jgi:DNA-binding NarL/FixJ family response regulator
VVQDDISACAPFADWLHSIDGRTWVMKVFLVEDSLAIRERLRYMVGAAGSEVVGEASGEAEAVAGVTATRPDLVVLDLCLASGSGVEALKRIKDGYPALRVVVLTNHVDPQYRKRCDELGADYFLDKSKEFSKLPALLAA